LSEPAIGTEQEAEVVRRQDVAHAARSGGVQVLTIAAQALITVTHVLLARLFGREVFGSYQASLAILEVLTRGGTGGADKGMLRYIWFAGRLVRVCVSAWRSPEPRRSSWRSSPRRLPASPTNPPWRPACG